MKTKIPISLPYMGDSEITAVERVIRSGWVTQGPEVEALESEFAKFVGAPYACAVSNCTTALWLALKAIGVTAGDEVIVPSHSFIASANSIRYTGAIPVFCEISLKTLNLDPEKISALISPKTKAILCVHQIGIPSELQPILSIARKHKLAVIEDAACAIGSEILVDKKWEKIGRPHGDIACFSFHPRKLLATGDGGMLTTKNPEWDKKFRLWRQHGMSVTDRDRHQSNVPIFETYEELGYNFRLTDLQAAIGREQLKRLPEIIERRRKQAAYYQQKLASIPGLQCLSEPSWARWNWQSFYVSLPANVDQREVMSILLTEGIATRRGVMCAHREQAYPKGTWRTEGSLRLSEKAQDEGILLPLFHEMTEKQQDTVVKALKTACENSYQSERRAA